MIETATSVADVLEALVSSGEREAILHLVSGHNLSGQVRGFVQRGERLVLLERPHENRRGSRDLSYVPLRSIVAITLDAVPVPAPEAPTRLQLRRRLEELEVNLSTVAAREVEVEVDLEALPAEAGPARVAALAAIEAVETAVRATASDALGAQALAGAFEKVSFHVGSRSFGQFQAGCFSVTVAPGEALGPEALQSALEAGL